MSAHEEDSHSELIEQEAAHAGVSYIKRDGAIGCLTQGAELAATMTELLEALGGRPAAIVDIEGATEESAVGHAIELLLSDPDVKVAWLSIRGDTARCDMVARALIWVLRERQVPFVVSLQGIDTDAARNLLATGPMTLMIEPALERAARLAVASSAVYAGNRKGKGSRNP